MQTLTRLAAAALMLAVLALSVPAEAQIHLRIPEDRQPPIYSFLSRGFYPHTDEWAAVVFYRTP
jgi:hypothetical protein